MTGTQSTTAAIVGGLAAGAAMSLAMAIGRRAGALHKTLAEDAEDWLDRVLGTRRRIGHRGTRAMEQANHLAAAAAFGFGYAQLHKHIPAAPAVMLGAIYGAGLYVTNIAGIAPLIRLTSGERNTSTPVRVERLGLHVLYGVVTAIVTDQLARRRERNTVLGSWSEV